MMKKTLIASALIGLFASTAVTANDNTEELRKVIAQQQEVLKSLEKRLDETEERLEATADQIESSTSVSPFSKTSIGGYGELHYNNYEDQEAKVDFHRFVLFFGHEFTDKIRFFSEFEFPCGLQAFLLSVRKLAEALLLVFCSVRARAQNRNT